MITYVQKRKKNVQTRTLRDMQAPHPMNLVAPHLLVELRSAGFIEICADLEEVLRTDTYVLRTGIDVLIESI